MGRRENEKLSRLFWSLRKGIYGVVSYKSLTWTKFKAIVDTSLRHFYFNFYILGMREEF